MSYLFLNHLLINTYVARTNKNMKLVDLYRNFPSGIKYASDLFCLKYFLVFYKKSVQL